MKRLLILLAVTGASTLAALDTTGSNLALNGSDSLFGVTQAVLAACGTQFGDFSAQNLTYLGGGSGVGAGQMDVNAQQVSPMSRALKNSELCSTTAPASPGLSESLLLGVDGVTVVANPAATCSTGAANGFGATAPIAVDATTSYAFTDSFDALRVLYFGLTHDGTYDCGGPVRRALVRNWRNLFASDCAAGDSTCSAGLTHAWRRGDLSGTTDAFVSILNPPGRGIGTLSNVPVGASQKINPFCNSTDANATPPTPSFGGSSDYSDRDPIRTPCTPQDLVCEGFPNFGTSGKFAGDLGLVLPVLIPDGVSAFASDLYPLPPCGTACTMVTPIKGSQIPAGLRCPGGSVPIAGLCFVPYAGPASAPDPRCVSSPTNRCVDVIGKRDGRAYNLAVIVSAAQIPTAQRGTAPYQIAIDANKRLQLGGFYRVHGQSGLCQQPDDTSQIGCLIDADPCSVGFAGRAAARSAPMKALAVNGVPPFTPGDDPDLALRNLLAPAGTTPLYPLSRRVYLTTLYGFGNLLGGEKELAQCFATNALLAPALAANDFVPVPDGVQCLDVPETAPIVTPLANVQGAGNVALGGCGATTDTDACLAAPISIQ